MHCGRVTEMTCSAGGSPGRPPWQDRGYLDLGQKGVNGGHVWQGGGDVQEFLGHSPPQLQVLQRPLGTMPQLHPRGTAQPGALPLHAVRAVVGGTERGESAVSPGTRPLPPPRGAWLVSPPVWSPSSPPGCRECLRLRGLRGLCPAEVSPSSNRLVAQLRDWGC